MNPEYCPACISERLEYVEARVRAPGIPLLAIAAGAGLLLLIATLIRKGVLKAGDLRETLHARG